MAIIKLISEKIALRDVGKLRLVVSGALGKWSQLSGFTITQKEMVNPN
jgi:hypothetical protein